MDCPGIPKETKRELCIILQMKKPDIYLWDHKVNLESFPGDAQK